MMTAALKRTAPGTRVAEGANRRRPRRPSLSNEDFLEKALEVFIDKGFEGASIEAITEAAGIAKRTVYARFGDKQTLFKAAIDKAIDDWILPVERLRSVETNDLEQSLLAIGQLLVDNILTVAGLNLIRLTNAESGRMPEIGQHNVRYGQEPTMAYLADLLRRHLPFGDAADQAEDAAEAFLHLVVGGPANAAAWGVVKDNETISRRTRLSIRIFFGGLTTVFGKSSPK